MGIVIMHWGWKNDECLEKSRSESFYSKAIDCAESKRIGRLVEDKEYKKWLILGVLSGTFLILKQFKKSSL